MLRKIAAIGFLALLALTAVLAGGVAAQDGSTTSSEQLIHTSSTGEVTTTPDRAIISVTVETENTDARNAQARNAEVMAAVIGALNKAGIASDDLKTTGFSIYPVYEDTTNIFTPKVRTYRVTNTLMVTLRDITRAGEITDLAVQSGANRIDYISFTLSDEKQLSLRSEALRSAIRQARADAEVVANASGLVITAVKDISVGASYVPAPYETVAYDKAAGATTPLQPGEVKVSAQVSMTYLVRTA
jgi:uncharacterized protein YggE